MPQSIALPLAFFSNVPQKRFKDATFATATYNRSLVTKTENQRCVFSDKTNSVCAELSKKGWNTDTFSP